MVRKKLFFGLLLGGLAASLFAARAEAVPSFARQTGLACAACHTVFPELTAFGRSFKLNGYTLTGIKQVSAKESPAASGLQFNQIPPLSAMLQVSGTYSKNQDPTSQVSLPDQLSFFFAGEISPHMGSFIQMTMEQGSGFSLDNTDIRYANHAGKVTYGVTVNNSPTVQDLWNSTPAWGFPFTHGADIAAPVVADALAQNVAGVGGYADWGNGLYTELTLYRDTNPFDAPGGAESSPGVPQAVRTRGLSPYVRVAWENNMSDGDSLMVGAYGMQTSTYAVDATTGGGAGPADKFKDAAIDTQYEHSFANSNNMLSVHASYTREKQTLDLSAPGDSPTLKSLRLDGTYHWGYHTTATLAYAQNKGYNSAYDDKAWTAQVSYLPWQNTKFTLQYVKYSKIGGQTSNVSDNNTTLAQAWIMW
ncbi:MAG TPA: hypothetical protein VKA50_11645 [Gammaproteobacteria bacterium]|nr:hypothetical protein [Gammaproteobacteria bacterium]